jgi:two-component system alkaline phosphatase synthesis response regulator PhoP
MGPPSRPGAARVLVVEDDASLRRLLEMRLGLDGYATRTAADGRDALPIIEEWEPQVVITDVMMPHLSGLALCRAIRDHPRLSDTPIIMLTAGCLDAEVQAVLDLGGITFMNKPYDAPRLNEALHAALRDSPVTSSSEPPERIR